MTRSRRPFRLALSVLSLLAVSAALAALSPAAAAAQAAAKKAPTVEDLMALMSAGSARISPDGQRVAYTVTETDLDQDAYVTQIWLVDVASGDAIQLTRGKKSSSDPAWSPDGRWKIGRAHV
jgi:hypothetical protein